jgi:hypothetical protein
MLLQKRPNHRSEVLSQLDKRGEKNAHTGAQTAKQGSVWKNASGISHTKLNFYTNSKNGKKKDSRTKMY